MDGSGARVTPWARPGRGPAGPRAGIALAAVAAALALGSLAACGGGGGGGSTPPTQPPTASITYTPAATSGTNFIHVTGTSGAGGRTLTLEVRAEGVSDLYGVAFDLGFPSAALRFDGSGEGSFLDGGGAFQTSLQVVESAPGNLVIGVTRLGDVAGADGSGLLLTLSFSSVASGAGPIGLSQRQAYDSAGAAQSEVRWFGGSLSVTL